MTHYSTSVNRESSSFMSWPSSAWCAKYLPPMKRALRYFFEGQAVGLFADFLYGSELVSQLTDLDNEILQLGAKMCG